MVAYILKRLLLIVPTLIGVTVVSFMIMRLSPGDPTHVASAGDSGMEQGSLNEEQKLIMLEQFHLDKPIILNFEYFKDYSEEAVFYSNAYGSTPDKFVDYLSGLSPDSSDYRIVKSLEISDYDKRLASRDKRLHAEALRNIKAKILGRGKYHVPAFMQILGDKTSSAQLLMGAILLLNMSVREPFKYTLVKDGDSEDQLFRLKKTWTYWWTSVRGQALVDLKDTGGWQRRGVFHELKSKSDRELVDIFFEDNPFSEDDGGFLVAYVNQGGPEDVKIATQALRYLFGKPIQTSFRRTPDAKLIRQIADNWLFHYELNKDEYSPSVPGKLFRMLFETQYFSYARDLFTFNFGRSLVGTREPVTEKIWRALSVSLPLILMAEVLIFFIAIPLGLFCAVWKDGVFDRLVSFGLFILYSVPVVWAGLMLRNFLCSTLFLDLFPLSGLHSTGYEKWGFLDQALDYLWHITLPVVCLSVFHLAGTAMYTRSSILDVMNQDYVRTARAKGLKESTVIWKHIFRNGLIPILTLFSYFLPHLVGGSIIVEMLFDIKGMGMLSLEAIHNYDYTTLLAVLYISAVLTLVSFLITDILYAIVDPRVSFEKLES